MGVSENKGGYPFLGLLYKDSSILGLLQGVPLFWEVPYTEARSVPLAATQPRENKRGVSSPVCKAPARAAALHSHEVLQALLGLRSLVSGVEGLGFIGFRV